MKNDDKCVLDVKFSYVGFIFEVSKYINNTFNVLLTSCVDSRLMVLLLLTIV